MKGTLCKINMAELISREGRIDKMCDLFSSSVSMEILPDKISSISKTPCDKSYRTIKITRKSQDFVECESQRNNQAVKNFTLVAPGKMAALS